MPDFRRIVRSAAAPLGLVPAERIYSEIRRRGVDLGRLRALEVFGADGERVTRFFGSQVASLEIWEIDPGFEEGLRRKFPHATVKIVDSLEEIKRATGPFDLISIDNPIWPREHFDAFPHVFRLLSNDSLLVFDVIPAPTASTRRRYPNIFGEEHLELRRRFYGTDHPERIELDELADHYSALAREHGGFRIDWHFTVRRLEIWYGIPRKQEVYFLCLKLSRNAQGSAGAGV